MQRVLAVLLGRTVQMVKVAHTQVVHTMAQAWGVEQVAVAREQNHAQMATQGMAHQAVVVVY